MLDKLFLTLYIFLTFLLTPFIRFAIKGRIKKGKEHSVRWREKLGEPSIARPSGKLIWLHAVGLGEVLALRGLIQELNKQEKNLSFLVTSSTILSAKVFEKNSPPKTIHQFLPYDTRMYCKRFLQYWAPDLVIWSEQDVWPGLSSLAANFGIKQVLVNGKMREDSYNRRIKIKPLHRIIYKKFEFISTQDLASKNLYEKLGASCVIRVDGSLKPHCPPLVYDQKKLEKIKKAVSYKSIWVVGSSFPEDEKIAICTQKLLRAHKIPKLLVLVPRFPNRTKELVENLRGFNVKVNSKGEAPNAKTDVFVADSIGELGLWYKASEVALIGGTFSSLEGKNPWEALYLDCAVFFGPRHAKFKDDFKLLENLNLASQIDSSEDLFKILSRKNNPASILSLRKLKMRLRRKLNILVKDVLTLVDDKH
mgnify:CR=1 FL=1